MLDEIELIVVENIQVSMTGVLLCMLAKKKIKIIFCDETHAPYGEVVPYQNNFYSYRKIREQIDFVKNQEVLWREIVKNKIYNQANNLLLNGNEESAKMLFNYIDEIEDGDASNREGHAAKVYFNSLFGNKFSRNDENKINEYLNYGYSVLAGLISREIKSYGYLTELGIHHIGESNSFNLTYDLIEPLRAFVDRIVIKKMVNEDNYKSVFVEMLSFEVTYNNQKLFLDNAIHLYITNIFSVMKKRNIDELRFIEYEL